MTQEYDVIILGAGPGGYVAAIRAAQLGLKTAIVEAEHMGGVCLNWGCIPTKALLRSSEIHQLLQHADEFGFTVKDISFDLEKIVQRSRKVSKQLSGGIQHLMKKNKIDVIMGYGRLKGAGVLEVEIDKGKMKTLKAPHIVLATGARPKELPPIPFDAKFIWSSKQAMLPDKMPKSLLIIGSGAIGMEFASFYNGLGAKVTIVELADRIMMAEDPEISAFAKQAFEKQGIIIKTESTVEKVTVAGDAVTAVIKGKKGDETLSIDRVIVAIGIAPNTEDIGLEDTKIKLDRGHVIVNEWMETGEPGVYAIGDIVGAPWLAHKASHEGVLVAEKIAGQKKLHPIDPNDVPGCTYATPQVASVGLTEAHALDAGYKIKVGRFPYVGNGKAIAMGEPEGLVKTIFDEKSGALLGAHIVGAEATELIQGFVIAKKLETTEQELMETIFPHPTLSEMMHESVLNAHDRAIHF